MIIRIMTDIIDLFDSAKEGQMPDGRWFYEVKGDDDKIEVIVVEEKDDE